MMGVTSEPWTDFANAVRTRFPDVQVHIAEPGFQLDLQANIPSQFQQAA